MDFQVYIRDILRNADQRWESLVRDFPRLRKKLYSELISNILEESIRVIVPGATVGVGDNEADVYVCGHPYEIKTIAENRVWRGGDFSKRPGDYLLISYRIGQDKRLGWFVLQTKLEESEWISSGSGNYYATSVDLDYILNRGDYRILWGDTVKKIKLNHPVYREVS